jgi:DNA-directed RNA polymerase subunit N (RpoN/RPB10)
MATKQKQVSQTPKTPQTQDQHDTGSIDVSCDGMMISCPTCGKIIGHLYTKYLILLREKQKKEAQNASTNPTNSDNHDILMELGLTRYCCVPHIIAYPLGLQDYT